MNRVPSAICGYPTHPCMGAALTPAGTLKNMPPNPSGIARGRAHSIRLQLCRAEYIVVKIQSPDIRNLNMDLQRVHGTLHRYRGRFFLLSFGLALGLSAPILAANKPDAVDFSAQIRPIISSKCFSCHGQDETSRKAKLRLDTREEAIKERKGRRAIVPGDLEKSELVARITSKDEDEVMPPPKTGHKLTGTEIGLFKRWIL